MGYCSPNYRNSVNEQEEQINQKGKDELPLFIKVILVIVMIGGLLIALFR
jgi:hypothetical protein